MLFAFKVLHAAPQLIVAELHSLPASVRSAVIKCAQGKTVKVPMVSDICKYLQNHAGGAAAKTTLAGMIAVRSTFGTTIAVQHVHALRLC